MKDVFNVAGAIFIAVVIIGLIFSIGDHQERLQHLESVTFESSRCPLINLRS